MNPVNLITFIYRTIHVKTTNVNEEANVFQMSYLGMDTYVNADMAQKENSVTKVKAFLSHLQSLVLTLFSLIITKSIGFGYITFHFTSIKLSRCCFNNTLSIFILTDFSFIAETSSCKKEQVREHYREGNCRSRQPLKYAKCVGGCGNQCCAAKTRRRKVSILFVIQLCSFLSYFVKLLAIFCT